MFDHHSNIKYLFFKLITMNTTLLQSSGGLFILFGILHLIFFVFTQRHNFKQEPWIPFNKSKTEEKEKKKQNNKK